MPCRDYESDYNYRALVQQGQEHLEKLTNLLGQLCQAMVDSGMQLPQEAAAWRSTPNAGRDTPLSKDLFDHLAKLLCSLCQMVEQKPLALPPAVSAWWSEHKLRDDHTDDFSKGLPAPPAGGSFWDEYAARQRNPEQVAGVNHLDAVRGLEQAGFRVLNRGRKRVTLANDQRILTVPCEDPVNPYAMAAIIQLAGLSEKEFREFL